MRDLIISSIKQHWNREIFQDTKTKHFFKNIMKVYKLLTFLNANETTMIGLCGRNSENWVAVYLATLLKGCTLVIIPPGMTEKEITHYLSVVPVNYLFAEHNFPTLLINDKINFIILKIIFDLHCLETTKICHSARNMSIDLEILAKENTMLGTHWKQYNKKEINDLFSDNAYPNDVETIITPTPGISFTEQKFVVHSSNRIKKFIEEATNKIPFDYNSKIVNLASYSRFHLINVLLPFTMGCTITNSNWLGDDRPDYFIETTESFEKMWKYQIQPLFYGKKTNYLLSKKTFYWLYRLIVLSKLKKLYNSKHTRGVIVLNNCLNEEIMSILRNSNFPLYTTYGSQETNQLLAVNDYSTKYLREKNCVGIILDGYSNSIEDNELCLISNFMFNYYYGDKAYSEYVKETGWYKTGDVAKIKIDKLFIYGRINSILYKDNNNIITLDEIERVIKGLPFIDEVMLFMYKNKLNLSIYLNTNFIEAKGMGYIESENLIKRLLYTINEKMQPIIKISSINISSIPLKKTFDNTIKKNLYREIFPIKTL